MKTPADGWDAEEQHLPDDLTLQLSRLAGDRPLPLEVLRAAGTGVLPPDVEQRAQHQLARSPLLREAVDHLDHLSTLEPDAQARIRAGIAADGGQHLETSPPARRWWLQAAAAVGAAAVLSAWLLPRSIEPQQPQPETPPVAATTPAPAFQLPLERPDVRISLRALTWRGSERANPILAALKPALDAFRNGDYQAADREFSAVAKSYPDLIEVALYQGISRLFLGDVPGALSSLRRAEAQRDEAFASDVSWYIAVAEERGGNMAAARARIAALCPNGIGDPRACAVQGR